MRNYEPGEGPGSKPRMPENGILTRNLAENGKIKVWPDYVDMASYTEPLSN